MNDTMQTDVNKTASSRNSNAPLKKSAAPRRRDNPQGGKANRRASDVIKALPLGWTARVVEPDAEGTKENRTRLRLMVLENPDKGFKVLPFMTVRVFRKMKVDDTLVETSDDMDILPHNILEQALPASLFGQGVVLESLMELLDGLQKEQAALPPPSKRPLTHRLRLPGDLLEAVKTVDREMEELKKRQPRPSQPQPKKNKKPRKRGRSDRAAVLLLPLV